MSINELQKDLVHDLVEKEAWDQVKNILIGQRPADLAELITDTPSDLRRALFDVIEEEAKPDVLAELEGKVEDDLLEALSNAEITEIVEEMAPDDAADVIGELDEDRSQKVLDMMEDEESQEVRELLKYDEESAGGIMTPVFLSFPDHLTVNEAFNLVAEHEFDEPIYYGYIVDENEHLMGYVGIWEMLRLKDRTVTVGEVAYRDVISARTDMDQEDVAKLFSKYDLTALPVLEEDGTLVGRITVDDVVDVVQEEASEDIFMLAGSDDAELESPSPLSACKSRLPWLLITLAAGFVTSLLLKAFMDTLSEVLVLTAFVPIVLAMGGSTGIQSSTLVVRSIALGTIKPGQMHRLLVREVSTGALMGLVCGIGIGIWAKYVIVTGSDPGVQYTPVFLGVTVGAALFCAMLFAALYGAFIPIALNRFRIDPAVASGPFVTASNDIAALVIYYAVTLGLIAVYYGTGAGA